MTALDGAPSLLRLQGFTVRYTSGFRLGPIDLELRARESLGVLGESGSGKTSLALALLRLLPSGARTSGEIRFEGRRLDTCTEREARRVRGNRISMVFQEPALALNPYLRTVDAVAEVLHAHRAWPRRRCKEEAAAVLGRLFPGDASRILTSYPHQLSGGQRQRVGLAQAVVCAPALLVADEPTASLDGPLQSLVLDTLREMRETLGLSIVFITHDASLLPGLVDRAIVVHEGAVVEDASVEDVLARPKHPKTRALCAASWPWPIDGGDGSSPAAPAGALA
jgi:peptide/nickel transport system ATP-binding protein